MSCARFKELVSHVNFEKVFHLQTQLHIQIHPYTHTHTHTHLSFFSQSLSLCLCLCLCLCLSFSLKLQKSRSRFMYLDTYTHTHTIFFLFPTVLTSRPSEHADRAADESDRFGQKGNPMPHVIVKNVHFIGCVHSGK